MLAVVLSSAFLLVPDIGGSLLKVPFERAASARFGREVTIAGSLQVSLRSRTPQVILNYLTIGGPSWDRSGPLARIRQVQLEFAPLPLLSGRLVLLRAELLGPEIYLHQEGSGRTNWRLVYPTSLAVPRDLVIRSGKLVLVDELRGLKIDGAFEAALEPSRDVAKRFRVSAGGTINGAPFRAQMTGGPLRGRHRHQAYPFALSIEAGENEIQAEGQVSEPFDPRALGLQLDATGRDLAQLLYLTQIAAPTSPPFSLSARIMRNDLRLAAANGSRASDAAAPETYAW